MINVFLLSLIAFFSVNYAVAAHASLELTPSEYVGFPNSLGEKHFFEVRTPAEYEIQTAKQPGKPAKPVSCRQNIAKVICLVEPAKDQKDFHSRTCLPGSKNYATYFEKLYDKYPPLLQKMFCSLKHLYVEKQFAGTAYASFVRDSNGKMAGAIMGIRQSVLDQNLKLGAWASWKEQLSFGGKTDSYDITRGLPTIKTSSRTKASDFLYFVVAHEFGHLFDFSNQLNKTIDCEPFDKHRDPEKECKFAKNTWGSMSWANDEKTLPSHDFANRTGLCFYGCNGKPLERPLVRPVYRGLAKTDFISLYAATNPWDDFAESLAYYIMASKLRTQYVIQTQQGVSYNMMNKLRSPIFNKKRKYIHRFLQRTDLKFP